MFRGIRCFASNRRIYKVGYICAVSNIEVSIKKGIFCHTKKGDINEVILFGILLLRSLSDFFLCEIQELIDSNIKYAILS